MTENQKRLKLARVIPYFDKVAVSDLELMTPAEIETMAKQADQEFSEFGEVRTIDIVRYVVGLSMKDVILLRHQEMEGNTDD